MYPDVFSIRTYLKRYFDGDFDSPKVGIQIDAGWYDWFCSDRLLVKKTQELTERLLQIVESEKIDQDTMYVFFKNNCPWNGTLYDDFRICSIATGDVLFTITPKSGHASIKGQASVWGEANQWKTALAEGTWRDVLKYFNV